MSRTQLRGENWDFRARWLAAGLLALIAGCTPLGLPWSPTDGPLPGGPPGGVIQASYHPETPPPEQIAVMTEKLSANEDDRKVLAARVGLLEAQLEEKEKALVLAGTEIAATVDEIARTRKEMQRWKQEVLGLRDRLRSVEKENKDALGAAIRLLEQTLERMPNPPRAPLPPSEEPPPGPGRPEPSRQR